MQAAADREDFEEAARLRDRIVKIDRMLERQRITQTSGIDQDVIGIARQGAAVDLQMLFVRGGLLIWPKDFFSSDGGDTADEEFGAVGHRANFITKRVASKELLVPITLEATIHRGLAIGDPR